MSLPNPAWSNCALLIAWDAIEAHVGPRCMPKVTRHTLEHLTAIEYGHGAYGVVMPTVGARGIVCKVTSDPSEAHTVSVLRTMRRPEGIVRYGPIFRLPGSRKGNPLYILWREEAFDVGKIFGRTREDDDARELLDHFFDETIPTCKIACSPRASARELAEVRESAVRFRGNTGYEDGKAPGVLQRVGGALSSSTAKAGRGLAVAVEIARELESLPKYRSIAKTLLQLIAQGVLVTDVHDGNFGYVQRNGRRVAVITDPGNVAFVTTRFDKTEPPDVMRGLSSSVRSKVASNERSARCGAR